uniref:Uncharacterized protein n=1 Tax=Siphoviridae sp. ctTic26 TaxID=2823583 RepID=A0A8S5LEX5_9CAUD|nr:MAG TPA: hypothetical protein [Siphoviridae sp. ctTic26]
MGHTPDYQRQCKSCLFYLFQKQNNGIMIRQPLRIIRLFVFKITGGD